MKIASIVRSGLNVSFPFILDLAVFLPLRNILAFTIHHTVFPNGIDKKRRLKHIDVSL